MVFVGSLVLCTDVHDTIGINIKGDFDLGNTTGCGRKTEELEVAKHFVVFHKFTFTLEDFDFDGCLTIRSGGKDLRFFGRDGGVATDEASEDTAESFDTEGERSNVEEKNVSDVS